MEDRRPILMKVPADLLRKVERFAKAQTIPVSRHAAMLGLVAMGLKSAVIKSAAQESRKTS